MQVRLKKLSVENFKGIEKFVLQLDGQSAVLRGQNGVGKTTLMDAFFWVISNSNSTNQSTFEILAAADEKKPPAMVEIEILADAKLINLRKIHKQKFSRKKGSAKPVFSGHTTEYFFNDSPVSMKKFASKLNAVIPENLGRTLSDVRHFCQRVKPDQRREILLKLLGEISDEQILNDNQSLEPLRGIFEGRTYNECKKFLNHHKKDIKRLLDELPVRVDELSRDDDKNEISLDGIEQKIADLKKVLEQKRIEIEPDMAAKKAAYDAQLKRHQEYEKQRCERLDMEDEIQRIENYISADEFLIDSYKKQLQRIDSKFIAVNEAEKELIATRTDVAAKTINTAAVEGICPTCKQQMPFDQRYEMKKRFNLQIAQELKQIDVKMTDLQREMNSLNDEKQGIEQTILNCNQNTLRRKSAIDGLKHKIAMFEKIDIDTIEVPAGVKTTDEIKRIEKQIDELNDFKLKIKLHEKKMERIEQIKMQIKTAAQEYEEIENQLFLLDDFIRIKTQIIEESINDLFAITTWRLFETQVNGDIKYICNATHNGVDYNSNLNTGAQINIGLDCINILSKHFDLHLPVWIDNAESITGWIDVDMQLIKLAATPGQKELRIGTDA